MNRSISAIIRDVLDNTDTDAIVTVDQVDRLHEELIVALERARIYTDIDPWGRVNAAVGTVVAGETTIHIESPHVDGQDHGVLDARVKGRAIFQPVMTTRHMTDVLDHYDVVIYGVTVPMDERGTLLAMRMVEPE
jgi:hypothetical protein